jgi:protein-S-isoprenylcysteine O-methyltransferase Ste14
VVLFLKNLIFTILVPGTVAFYVPVFVFTHQPFESTEIAILSVPLLVAGSSIYFWCLWDFASFGRGTPLPLDPPKSLVVRGLYRYIRNPMYVGVVTTIFGWALFYESADISIYGVCTALVFHLVVLVIEEPILRKSFGPAYDEYCAKVNRWLPTRKAT